MKAQIFIHYEKSDVWDTIVELADDKSRKEFADNKVLASFMVKSYDLTDHQFVSVKMNAIKGKEFTVLFPRSVIVTIIEGRPVELGFGSLPTQAK